MPNFQTYKDVKIAVYAICKNEAKFIDSWLRNIWCDGNGADGVYVLDTGSTDTTLQDFKSISKDIGVSEGWLIVNQKTYEKWRFDVARNDNLAMIPSEKYNVFYCIDLDEKVIPDFWDDLRKMVFEHPNFERIFYQYAWSHDDSGKPKLYFWYDKIHQPRGWRWDFPVHEALKCDNIKAYGYSGYYYLDEKKIYLHHYPDPTKSRGSYLGLLQLRAEEYPNDLYGLYYLAREYSFYKQTENVLSCAFRLYSRLLKDTQSREEIYARDDMNMLPCLCCLIGDSFKSFGMKDDAKYYYRKAILFSETYRDSYIKLAQLLAYQGKSKECYEVLDEMDKKSKKIIDWRISDWVWRDWKRYQIIADAKCWEGKYEEAGEYFQKALEDIRISSDKNDAANEGFYNDLEWYKNYCKK